MNYLVVLLYLLSFAMFIYGLMGLTGPRTAVRGNWIAAAGMAIALVATLIAIRQPTTGSDHRRLAARCGAGGAARPADEDDRDAAVGGVLQRRRRRHRRAHRFVGIHRHRRFFGVQARGGANGSHRDRVVVRRDHRFDLVLGLADRVRQAAGDPAAAADRPTRQGAAGAQRAAAARRGRLRSGDRPRRVCRAKPFRCGG